MDTGLHKNMPNALNQKYFELKKIKIIANYVALCYK